MYSHPYLMQPSPSCAVLSSDYHQNVAFMQACLNTTISPMDDNQPAGAKPTLDDLLAEINNSPECEVVWSRHPITFTNIPQCWCSQGNSLAIVNDRRKAQDETMAAAPYQQRPRTEDHVPPLSASLYSPGRPLMQSSPPYPLTWSGNSPSSPVLSITTRFDKRNGFGPNESPLLPTDDLLGHLGRARLTADRWMVLNNYQELRLAKKSPQSWASNIKQEVLDAKECGIVRSGR